MFVIWFYESFQQVSGGMVFIFHFTPSLRREISLGGKNMVAVRKKQREKEKREGKKKRRKGRRKKRKKNDEEEGVKEEGKK